MLLKIALSFFCTQSEILWPSDILNTQNHSDLSYFEAILSLKHFLLKIWQSGSVWQARKLTKKYGNFHRIINLMLIIQLLSLVLWADLPLGFTATVFCYWALLLLLFATRLYCYWDFQLHSRLFLFIFF